jgi:hypothetical protein
MLEEGAMTTLKGGQGEGEEKKSCEHGQEDERRTGRG